MQAICYLFGMLIAGVGLFAGALFCGGLLRCNFRNWRSLWYLVAFAAQVVLIVLANPDKAHKWSLLLVGWELLFCALFFLPAQLGAYDYENEKYKKATRAGYILVSVYLGTLFVLSNKFFGWW